VARRYHRAAGGAKEKGMIVEGIVELVVWLTAYLFTNNNNKNKNKNKKF
jgi:hypothetical protein